MTTRLTKPPVKPEPLPEISGFGALPEPGTPLLPNLFAIKPTDKLAPATLRAWIGEAYMEGVNIDKITKAVQHYNDIVAWQLANPDKVKVPD